MATSVQEVVRDQRVRLRGSERVRGLTRNLRMYTLSRPMTAVPSMAKHPSRARFPVGECGRPQARAAGGDRNLEKRGWVEEHHV